MLRTRWVQPMAVAVLLTGCVASASDPGASTTSAAPSSSGPLLLGPVGLAEVDGTAWAAWAGSGAITPVVEDGTPGEAVAVGDTPLRIAALDGSVWVTTFGGARLTQVDAATGVVGRTVDVGEEPEGVAASDWHLLVVLQKEAALAVVEPATGEVVARYELGGAPRSPTRSRSCPTRAQADRRCRPAREGARMKPPGAVRHAGWTAPKPNPCSRSRQVGAHRVWG